MASYTLSQLDAMPTEYSIENTDLVMLTIGTTLNSLSSVKISTLQLRSYIQTAEGTISPFTSADGKIYLKNPTDKVGIGTSSPQYQLHIGDGGGGYFPSGGTTSNAVVFLSATNPGLYMSDTNDAPVGDYSIYRTGGLPHTAHLWQFHSIESGVSTNQMIILTGGNVGIGATDPTAGLEIVTGSATLRLSDPAVTTHSWLIDHYSSSGALHFVKQTQIGDATLDTTMVLSGNRVGIGTAAPTSNLHILGDAGHQTVTITAPANSDARLTFEEGTTNRWSIGNDGDDTDKFKLSTGGDLTEPKLTVDSSGNVGIGTTVPSEELTVSGGISALEGLSAKRVQWPDGTVQTTAATGGMSKYTAAWAVSHGSVTVANGSTHTITHNLGTNDIQVEIWANSSASDVGAEKCDGIISSVATYGAFITSIPNTNSCVVQLGDSGIPNTNSSGSAAGLAWTSLYMKVVVIG